MPPPVSGSTSKTAEAFWEGTVVAVEWIVRYCSVSQSNLSSVNPDNPDARKKMIQLKAQEADQRKRERSLFAGLRGVCTSAGTADCKAPKTVPEPAGPDSSDEETAVQCGEDSDVEELTPEQEKLLQQGLTDREASARLVSSLGMATKQGPADPHFVQPSNMTVGPEVFWAPESFRGKNVRRSLAEESS
ncbi:unnamed protein product [Symbiodinium necroappetens]|uniref:Uncharacterized protein n=2 Tax=Symbiodinium TaxID=2949 RepID=A0A812MGA9_9DINO|nr:hypothetical protein AK812_SmicGene1946 [Symbiodinium microadriaticum]CAE7255839.1 unnamed protein product [Symbiodinium necroappetens]CAE7669664.1 unnamed protein product [Symbiodinium microadriaticum]CAE7930506.1 unnamed protein product [Symbiodinium sp. KB8]